MKVTDFTVPDSPCPSCGEVMSAACNLFDKEAPSPGDLTICMECLAMLTFDQDRHLRAVTDAEIKEWAGDPRLKQIFDVLAAAKAQP